MSYYSKLLLPSAITASSISLYLYMSKKINYVPFSDIDNIISFNNLEKIRISNDVATFISKNSDEFKVMTLPQNYNIYDLIKGKGIILEYNHSSFFEKLIFNWGPTLILLGGLIFMMKRPMGLFNKGSKMLEKKTNIKLDDVVGLNTTKEEVMDLVNIVVDKKKYKNMGVQIPKGILLEGPPGTGKTHLAKAIANHIDYKFYYMSGSDFIQMFVGAGNERVKALFNEAKMNKPSMIFIDEIDAIGKKRTSTGSMSNEERENTLNSILVQMDGFDDLDSVFVLGATNRVEILDPALLRPGRFDRIVKFTLPEKDDRRELVEYYLSKTKYNEDEYQHIIDRLTNLTTGCTGADIKKLCNEAGIYAIKENSETIHMKHFEEAFDYTILGAKSNNVLDPRDKERVAYHECGHAILNYILNRENPPQKITIIPRKNGVMGFSQMYHDENKKLLTRENYDNHCKILMAGRIAEWFKYDGKISQGSYDDLQKINSIQRELVTKLCLDNTYNQLVEDETLPYNNISDRSTYNIEIVIEKNIKNIVVDTKRLLTINWDKLVQMAELLIQKETIYLNDIREIMDTNSNTKNTDDIQDENEESEDGEIE